MTEFANIDQHNPGDARLDSGMLVTEAIERALLWWGVKGREMARQRMLSGNKGAEFNSQDPTSDNYLPSGLMLALEWEELSDLERLMVTKVWHHYFVRVPDMEAKADGFRVFRQDELQTVEVDGETEHKTIPEQAKPETETET